MDQMLPQQHISGVNTQNSSRSFVGAARDVYFAGKDDLEGIPNTICILVTED
jgi:hypothetical protein